MRPITNYKHQDNVFADRRTRLMLVWSTGAGKTHGLIGLARRGFSCLVVCPKTLKKKWLKDVAESGLSSEMDVLVLTKEEFKKANPPNLKLKYRMGKITKTWQEEQLKLPKLPYYDVVLIDEVDWFSNMDSQLFKAMVGYLGRVNPSFLYTGTATPYRSTPWNIYALGLLHGYNVTEKSKDAFDMEFFYDKQVGADSSVRVPKGTPRGKPSKKNFGIVRQTDAEKLEEKICKDGLNKYLLNFADIVRLEDIFDVPEQIYITEEIEMTDEQKTYIKHLRKTVDNLSSLNNYMHQIESGHLKRDEEGKPVHVAENKTERILELCEQHSTLVIFTGHREHNAALYESIRAKYAKDDATYVQFITAENSQNAVPIADEVELIAQGKHEKYKRGYVVLMMQISSGFEMPSVPVAVFAGRCYGFYNFVQSQGRLIRGNKLRTHTFITLLGGPIDKTVLQSHESGKDFDPANHSIDSDLDW